MIRRSMILLALAAAMLQGCATLDRLGDLAGTSEPPVPASETPPATPPPEPDPQTPPPDPAEQELTPEELLALLANTEGVGTLGGDSGTITQQSGGGQAGDPWEGLTGNTVGGPPPNSGSGGLGLSGIAQGGGGTGTGGFGLGSIGSGGSSLPQGFSRDCSNRGAADTAEGEGYTCITLLYGTNRQNHVRFGELDEQQVYNVRPDPVCEPGADDLPAWCHLGVLSVTVPDTRRRGDPINSVPRDATSVSDRQRQRAFSIWNYEEIDEARFDAIADRMLADAMGRMGGQYDNQAIVFIHGFNVRFRDAAFRAAQIKYDLDFPGPVFFYSWPANGSVLHYLADMDDADLSVDGVAEFLRLVRRSLPDAEINVIAHSMGTRVFAQALNRVVAEDPEFQLNHVFFASGDLDRNLFVEWVEPAAPNMASVTLYTSGSDVAVASSQLLRNLFPSRDVEEFDRKTRIGFYQEDTHPPVFSFQVGASASLPQTIDMTRGRFSFFGFATRYLLRRADLGHSDYMERTPIIEDMSCILRFGALQPNHRHDGMAVTWDDEDGTYYRFTGDGEPTPACPPVDS